MASTTAAENRAQAAEGELRQVLILQLLERKVGEVFEGVITGVTNFGMFVQLPRILIEGLVRMEDLGDDWWEIDAANGQVRGEQTGESSASAVSTSPHRLSRCRPPPAQPGPHRQLDNKPPAPKPKAPPKANKRAKGPRHGRGRGKKRGPARR